MDDEEFTYKNLRKVQQSEKQSPKLTKIPKSFYNDVKNYLEKLRNQLENETKHKRQMLLADEIQNMEKIITNIYEHREKKIIMAAMSRIRGGNPHLHDLLDTELKLFDTLQKLLKDARKIILSDASESEPVPITTKSKPDIENIEEQLEMRTEKSSNQKNQPILNNNEMVRIIKDMPTFVGTDAKQYSIKVGDVLSVPSQMANMLVKRRIAERINMMTQENT